MFQVVISEGVCYGQVVNTDPKWKFVIAIFWTFHAEEPADFTDVVSAESQFITTFLINHAVKRGLLALLGNVPVAEHLKEFPVLKATNNFKGPDTLWFFWKGDQEYRVARPLTDEEQKYPQGPSFPNLPLLIEMIEDDYRVDRHYV